MVLMGLMVLRVEKHSVGEFLMCARLWRYDIVEFGGFQSC